MENRIRASWNGTPLTSENGFSVIGGTRWQPTDSDEQTGPSLSVSGGPDGFISVLARPEGTNRTITLTIDESPRPGIYRFTPSTGDYEIEVRLEFDEEPFPEPQMKTLNLNSELSSVEIGDEVVIGLRKDATESPGVKEIRGTVIELVDSSGAVPDSSLPFIDYSDSPIVSVLIDLSDRDTVDTVDIEPFPILSRRLKSVGDSQGTIDVVGTSKPFEIRWEGSSKTPALQVEYVTVDPRDDDSWTVANDSLPEVQFSSLHELTFDERVEQFEAAFDRASEISLSDDVIRMFASAVDGQAPEVNVTVRYESSKSDQLQSKSGILDSVESVYYADPNRARHQIRFKDTTLYYLLVDPHVDAAEPVSVYSKAYGRHWDTNLGDVCDIEISEPE
jgi:hypothetical protein